MGQELVRAMRAPYREYVTRCVSHPS
eukprot:COSAG01_NODE_62719_length_283_cov_0.842391_1_plen_26_part_01